MKKIITYLTVVVCIATNIFAAPTPFESAKLIVDQKIANLDALRPQISEAVGKYQTTMLNLTQQRAELKQKIQAAALDLKSTQMRLQQQSEAAENELKSALSALDKAAASDPEKTTANTTRIIANSKIQAHNQSTNALSKIESTKLISD